MKLGLVVVQYYVGDAALRRCVGALRTRLSGLGIEVDEVRVDLRVSDGTVVARYPFLDISGYREGLARLPAGQPVLLLNDTFFSKHPWRTYAHALLRLLRALAGLEAPVAAGVVKKTMNLLVLDERNPTRQHLSTFLVALNPAGRRLFEGLLARLPGDEDPLGETWLSRVLSANPALELLIRVHFAADANPWSWEGLTHGTDAQLIQRKKVSVAVEYMLSQEILRSGGLILPINVHSRQWIPQQVERLLRRCLPGPRAGVRSAR